MPAFDLEVRVEAPRDIVFEVARDVQSFPSFMPDVESIEILEQTQGGERTLTRWVGLVREFKQKVRWTEEDNWDAAQYTCKFHQTEGDYQRYEGEWRFIDADGSTIFQSTIAYELEIPLIGPLLKTIIAKKMRDNTMQVLTAIKARAEQRHQSPN